MSLNNINIDDYYLPGVSQESFVSTISQKNLKFFVLLSLVIFGILFFWIFHLQVIKGSIYQEMAEGNRLRIEKISAIRGNIYDRNGNILATNQPRFFLAVVPGDLPRQEYKRQAIVEKIIHFAQLNNQETEKLSKISSSNSYEPFFIKELNYQKAILTKIFSADLAGVMVKIIPQRIYPPGSEFSHLLGYLISDKKPFGQFLGKTGLESFYQKDLKGVDGLKRIGVNSLGKEEGIAETIEGQSGSDLSLSIDYHLQKKIAEAFQKKGFNSGAAIALDPRNGEILALLSFPFYDNNLFNLNLTQEEFQNLIKKKNISFFNRAISGEYPPGSTIKPLIAIAALNEELITPKTIFHSVGGIRVGKWFFPDWLPGGHGLTNLSRALAWSINTFFYIIGGGYGEFKGLGEEKISYYSRLFGLGQITGIDLTEEKAGFLPNAQWKETIKGEKWYIGDTYHLSIGQGDILVTPLQMANLTAAIANNGTLFKPKLKKDSPSEIIRSNFIKKEHFQAVKEGLRLAVLSGSARRISYLDVAGKTGTAQVKDGSHAWFTGWAPYQNPEIVLTILVEKGGEGSATAVPIAEEVFNWYFREFR